MKIALVGINYSPELTGIAVYTTGMAEYIHSQGYDVTVYTGFPYYPMWSKLPDDHARWRRDDVLNGVKIRRSYLYVPASPSALKRMLHEFSFVISASLNYLFGSKADITIIVSPPLFLGIPIALIAKLKGSKTIFHVQDLQPDAAVDLGMLKRGMLTSMFYFFERLTYRMVNSVSTISQGMMKKIVDKGINPGKVFLFRNWANDNAISPLPKETTYRDELGLSDKFVVLYSGNMGVKQGLGTLLATAELLKDDASIVFLLVGDGGEKFSLQDMAARSGLDNMLFLPVQPFERLSELLATADVAVIPQKKGVNDIVLPSKLGNIMASQRALIAAASRDCEFGRIVLESRSGVLVEPEEPKQMAEAIRRLARRPDECEEMGRNGKAYMEAHFSRQGILGEFVGSIRLFGSK